MENEMKCQWTFGEETLRILALLGDYGGEWLSVLFYKTGPTPVEDIMPKDEWVLDP